MSDAARGKKNTKGYTVLFWVIVVLLIGLLLYIRLAPSDPANWHMDIPYAEDKVLEGGVVRVIEGDAQTLQSLVSHAQITGAQVLAGSVEEGHITLIARTQWIGFPDYATMQLREGRVVIWSRLRFGKADLGVNAKRVAGWLKSVE